MSANIIATLGFLAGSDLVPLTDAQKACTAIAGPPDEWEPEFNAAFESGQDREQNLGFERALSAAEQKATNRRLEGVFE